ncbi:MAG: DUF2752 domain-containing protein [Gemmataceae bacterium]
MGTQSRRDGFSRCSSEPLAWWVRGALLLVIGGLVGVLVVAARIHPYREDGVALRRATHQQLGLPECGFLKGTGVPCPSCGLTTSFALTIRGDWLNAARANWVGLVMVLVCLVLIPWGVASALTGRAIGVPSLERAILVGISCLFVMLMVRWVFVLWWREG